MIESGFSREIAVLDGGIRRGLAMKLACKWTEGGASAAGPISTSAWKVFEKVHRGGVKPAGQQKPGMSDGEGPDHTGLH